ncbi:MAG: hypothetical protein LBR64_10045 [Dysgonamonadaceae bacterium]|jgi:hypothetical protein|nr:hypothetical protein [Dysgonamonadaceae bacterium]
MLKNILKSAVSAAFFAIILSGECLACTSAIFTGKVTPDGRPLMWKHRDTGDENNHIAYFKGEKYAFLALLNSHDSIGKAWTGVNSEGFSIMNTASYNLQEPDEKSSKKDEEGALMYSALANCKNLGNFERFLDEYPRPMGVEVNFGVIDAEGGAAYYEVNNTRWVKVDANDEKIAPNGYLIYTNFSYTGRFDEGAGYERYQTASGIISRNAALKIFTPQWIFNNLSRSFEHSILGIDLTKPEFSPENASGWTIDQDFIPRKITSASVVIQGVKPTENPEMTIMWTVLGYPPAGIALPLWVKPGADQPAIVMREKDSKHAEICSEALKLKYKSFPIKRGNGSKYLYFTPLYNKAGTGYMQKLAPYENRIFNLYAKYIEKWRKTGVSIIELKSLNNQVISIIREGYRNCE